MGETISGNDKISTRSKGKNAETKMKFALSHATKEETRRRDNSPVLLTRYDRKFLGNFRIASRQLELRDHSQFT